VVEGDFAYIANREYGLLVLDISDPANIAEVSSYSDADSYTRSLAIQGNYAYLCDATKSIQVVDITDPHNPVGGARIDVEYPAYKARCNGNRMYIGLTANGMGIADLSDPAIPALINSIDPANGSTEDIGVYGDVAYIADNETGVHVYDISDELNPIRLSKLFAAGPLTDMKIHDDMVFITAQDGGVHFLDISDHTYPVRLASMAVHSSVYGVDYHDQLLYLAHWDGGITVNSAADPLNATAIGLYNDGLRYGRIIYRDGYAYAAAYQDGFHIFTVSNPQSPAPVYQNRFLSNTQDVDVANGYAYVCDYRNGVVIFDVADPANPDSLTLVPFNEQTRCVAVDGNRMAVLTKDPGFQLVDITDKTNPVKQGSHSFGTQPRDLDFEGDRIVFVDNVEGVALLDISNPASPEVLFEDDLHVKAYRVRLIGDTLYVASQNSGISIYRLLVTTGIEEIPSASTALLHPVYPNPAAGSVSLTYSLETAGTITIAVYDQLGRKVRTLHQGTMQRGTHSERLDLTGLPAGVYSVVLNAGTERAVQKVILR
ncbi:MAG: hypothetical protein CL946_01900, partial [Ectothiorhodospiraceae bacterium]|nr:hypothetical protein [Ectothiorhodospiraceae bacterium]